MALSHEEQKRLEELEKLLAADDPQLARTLRGSSSRTVDGRRLVVGAAGFLAGIGLLIAGMQWHWSIAVVGFVVMLASAAWLFLGRPRQTARPVPRPRTARGGASRTRAASTRRGNMSQDAFMDKVEERWRRRQEGGR